MTPYDVITIFERLNVEGGVPSGPYSLKRQALRSSGLW